MLAKNILYPCYIEVPHLNLSLLSLKLFLSNFKNIYSQIKSFAIFFTWDFNGHFQFWWPERDTNPEGREIEDLFTSLNVSQIISEPSNFGPGKMY